MNKYFKTLTGYRWIALLAIWLPLMVVGFYITEIAPYWLYSLLVTVSIFTLDITIGIGRRIDDDKMNLIGISYLIVLIVVLFKLIELNPPITKTVEPDIAETAYNVK